MNSNGSQPPKLRGWITPLVGSMVRFISGKSELILGRRLESQEKADDLELTSKRAKRVDTYIAVWIMIEAAFFLLVSWLRGEYTGLCWVLIALVAFRILDIPCTAVRIAVFDGSELPKGVRPVVASHERIVVLGFTNFFELIGCFAVIYAIEPQLLGTCDPDWFDPLYFSVISQLTIGYGDLQPVAWLRPVACLQGLLAILVLFLLIGRFISVMPPERSLDYEQRKQKDDSTHGASSARNAAE